MNRLAGTRFWKMSGSGNDFIFLDATREAIPEATDPAWIARACARRTGIGADGVVLLEPHGARAFFMRYLNRDGSLAEMCGNAALCSARLARDLGIVDGNHFTFESVSGPVEAWTDEVLPRINIVPVKDLAAQTSIVPEGTEARIGFARVGVPHLVVLVPDLGDVDVTARGRALRHDVSLPAGANVNFVSASGDGTWAIRTYERGVEEETLACGTGSVASAALLARWGLLGDARSARLATASGCTLQVELAANDAGAPRLSGEARLVFTGIVGAL